MGKNDSFPVSAASAAKTQIDDWIKIAVQVDQTDPNEARSLVQIIKCPFGSHLLV